MSGCNDPFACNDGASADVSTIHLKRALVRCFVGLCIHAAHYKTGHIALRWMNWGTIEKQMIEIALAAKLPDLKANSQTAVGTLALNAHKIFKLTKMKIFRAIFRLVTSLYCC